MLIGKPDIGEATSIIVVCRELRFKVESNYMVTYIGNVEISDKEEVQVDIEWTNTSNGSYKFVQEGFKWQSNNNGVNSSTASSTWQIDMPVEYTYKIKYKVSSETNYDKLTLTLDGVTIVNAISGNGEELEYNATLSAGKHTLVATYSKDGSTHTYDDMGYVILEKINAKLPGNDIYSKCQIENISCNGLDIYVYDLSTGIYRTEAYVYAENNGVDKEKKITLSRVDDGLYYARVNVSDHEGQAGAYKIRLDFINIINEVHKSSELTADIPNGYGEIVNITADDLIRGVKDNDIATGKCNMTVNGKVYYLDVVNIEDLAAHDNDGNYTIGSYTAGKYDESRTAVVKCKSNLTVTGTITTQTGTIDGYSYLTKVKGLFVCINGKLTNNGTITMTARGTYNTQGEDIYLWKKADGAYEYVPAQGAGGGSSVSTTKLGALVPGDSGDPGTARKTRRRWIWISL